MSEGQGDGQGDGQGQGDGEGGKGPTIGELATRVDGLASKVDALITTISTTGSSSGGGGGKTDPAAAAGDLQSQVQAEVAKIRDAAAADAAARGEKDWRDSVNAFMQRHPETTPAEPQRGLRGVLQRALIGTPREQREHQASPPVPAAAPPGGGGKR